MIVDPRSSETQRHDQRDGVWRSTCEHRESRKGCSNSGNETLHRFVTADRHSRDRRPPFQWRDFGAPCAWLAEAERYHRDPRVDASADTVDWRALRLPAITAAEDSLATGRTAPSSQTGTCAACYVVEVGRRPVSFDVTRRSMRSAAPSIPRGRVPVTAALRHLSTGEYGALRVYYVIASVVSGETLSVGIAHATLRFYFDYTSRTRAL